MQTRGIRRGGLPADAGVRALVVLVFPPFVQHVPGFGQTEERLAVEQFVPLLAIE